MHPGMRLMDRKPGLCYNVNGILIIPSRRGISDFS